MHGCSSVSVLLVNAEVDSMGGVVDGGAGIGVKTSPRRAAIEKAQAELRQEYDVREERRRELEFLEKGGNPLDFRFGNAASLSVQSTSLTDQHPEQFVTSEAKGSFALTASPHGDSVESSGRPGNRTVCEPNSADNLLLFDGENELLEKKKNSVRPGKRNNIAPSEQSTKMDGGGQTARESEDSTIFRPYARRNRSKSNREGTRSSSTDIPQSRGSHGSLVARGGSRDAKGSICEINKQKDQNVSSLANPKFASSNGDMVSKIVTSQKQLDMELDGMQGVVVSAGLAKPSLSESKLDVVPKDVTGNQKPQPAQVDDQEPPCDVDMERPNLSDTKEQVISATIESPPCVATTSVNEVGPGPVNGPSNLKVDRKSILNEVQNSSAVFGMKGLDSESSCTQTSLCLDVNNDSDVCTDQKIVDSNGNSIEQKSKVEGLPNFVGDEIVKQTIENKAVGSGTNASDDPCSIYHKHSGNGSIVKVEEEIQLRVPGEQSEVKYPPSNLEGVENNVHITIECDRKVCNVLGGDSNTNRESSSTGIAQSSLEVPTRELPTSTLLVKDSSSEAENQTSDNRFKLADKAREDSVLEEARIIEAKRKRIAELSVGTLPSENRRKSHWDLVLEEMTWLANDFAQERLWKITAAAQMGRLVASASRLRFEQQNQHWKLKKAAHTLANAVMQFWHSMEAHLSSDICIDPKNGNGTSEDKIKEPNMKTIKEVEESPRQSLPLAVQGYAVRFLKSTSCSVPPLQAEAPATPDKISDVGITEMSWEDHLTEENLFYTIPFGAMEAYRKSIESHLAQAEKTCSSMPEDVETHMYDAVAEYGYQESTYDEDEGETSTYYLPGAFEGSKSSNQKKRKKLSRSYSARPYDMSTDVPYGHLTTGAQQSMLMGKRPANNLNVGAIPTKRMRTATRQRVLSPFGAGGTGGAQAAARTDASSGDTSSFQDDQSTLHGGSQIQKSVEVESAADFEKQRPYDTAETSAKPKKKKKPKHLGNAYDQGWHLDSTVHSEQRDSFKKRSESHHFDSNGTSGLYGQHNAKRPKIMKQTHDNNFDSTTPMSGSIPSPAASMSNMSNPNKFIKLLGGRDRGRKVKGLKISAGQPGSGSPWSLFEDQALVVLVHDMGPNWELVSDAINSTLQFKCIFRKPKECKERHKVLMDRSASDGADSAEDSGSSQSYPSTLPGIPKGSARQLFQCLQGPMLEDTLKSHFEKIIIIGQKQHYRRSQNDNQDPKQIATVHNSHVIALSQAFPNNLNGSVLTPLDLCDTTPSSPDVLPHGYQGSHAGGLTMSNQGAAASLLPTSGPNSSLQGSSGMVLGGNLQSPPGPLSASVRDGRFGVPRASLPTDDHQRIQQYNQMLSGRNIPQSNMSFPGALSGSDHRGARINGMGMMSGMNRNMPMARPGFQGMPPSSMLNSGGMISSSMVGMPSSAMHSGGVSGQGSPMMRPREAMHMMRPGHNSEHQRQMMVPDQLPMQMSQGNSPGIAPINGLTAAFSNQTTSPPVQTFPGHTQPHQMPPQQPHVLTNPHHPHHQAPNHAAGSQQQAYAIRIAKERQQQQRYLQQQQQQQQQPQQFAASNSLMPHAQPQPQHPISPSLPNSAQIQSQTASQPLSLPPLTPSSPMAPIASQHQQKHHLQSGLGRNPQSPNSGLTNQMGKQRQRQAQQQQFQQSGRHHPQQRQHTQTQQQAKLMKGVGRGNQVVHQNLPIDPSHLNGLTVAAGTQSGEKGEPIVHLMQNQAPYSGSGLNSVQPSKPLAPQKPFSGQTPSKQLQPMPSHSDSSVQGQASQLASGHTFSASHQAVLPTGVANHQQQQPQPNPVNQTQPVAQRMLQQNRQVQSDQPGKAPVEQSQDQQFASNALQAATASTVPQTCVDSSDPVPVVSSPVTPQWKASEATNGSGALNTATQVPSVGSDPIPPVSQGLGQRQLSSSLPPHGHNTGTQRHQQPQLQQSSIPPPHSTQQHYQAHEQSSPQLQEERQLDHQSSSPSQLPSQQQTQHLPSGQGSLYIRPTTSKLEGSN